MENPDELKAVIAAEVKVAEIAVRAKLQESYTHRIRRMNDHALKCEVIRQGKSEFRKSNAHGVILATVLNIFMDGMMAGKELYPR